MNSSKLHGVVPILHTAFTDDGGLDDQSFQRQVEFCVQSKVSAVAFPSMASEFYTLTDDERRHNLEIAIETTKSSSLPVIAGVTSVTRERAGALATHAESAGASAILSMPEFPRNGNFARTLQYFKHVSACAPSLPIILQTPRPDEGTVLGVREIVELQEAIPNLRYVKAEAEPSGPVIGNLVSELGDKVDGIFSGNYGLTQTTDAQRGAIGCMPGVGLVDKQVRVQAAIDSGDYQEASRLQNEIQFGLELLHMYPTAAEKRLMKLRGIFSSDRFRDPKGVELDPFVSAQMDKLVEALFA